MEGVAIDPLARVHASLQHGDTINLDVSDVGAGLAPTKVICVLDGVVAGLERIILDPVLKGWVVGAILLITIIEGGGWSRNEWNIPHPGKQGFSRVGDVAGVKLPWR
jgi:hypothetical protein